MKMTEPPPATSPSSTTSFIQLLLDRQHPLSLSNDYDFENEIQWYTNYHTNGQNNEIETMLWPTSSPSSSTKEASAADGNMNTDDSGILLESIEKIKSLHIQSSSSSSHFTIATWGSGMQTILPSSTKEEEMKKIAMKYDCIETIQIIGLSRICQILLYKGVMTKETTPAPFTGMLIKVADSLIQLLTRKVCKSFELLYNNDNNRTVNNDNNNINHNITIQIATFYTYILTKGIHPIACQTKVLASVLKGMCTISDYIHRFNSSNYACNSHHHNRLQRHHHFHKQQRQQKLILDIVLMVTGYLTQGKNALSQLLSYLNMEHMKSTSQQPASSSSLNIGHSIQCLTIQKFFLVRLLQMIPILISFMTQRQEQHQQQYDKQNTMRKVEHIFQKVMSELIQYKGLFVIIQTRMMHHKNNNGDSQEYRWMELKSILHQSCKKVHSCIEDLVIMTNKNYHHNQMNSSSPSTTTITTLIVNHDVLHRIIQFVHHDNDDINDDVDKSFWLGKLSILLYALEALQNQIINSNDKKNNVSGETKCMMIDLCENLFFSTMPRCHGWLTSTTSAKNFQNSYSSSGCDGDLLSVISTSTITKAIATIVKCTLLLKHVGEEELQIQKDDENIRLSKDKIDLLLVRWLCPQQRIRNKKAKQSCLYEEHPLTHTLVLSIIHLHIMNSLFPSLQHQKRQPRQQQQQTEDWSQNIFTNALGLVRIMGKLVFDERIQSLHRCNLCTVLVRIFKSIEMISTKVPEYTKQSNVILSNMELFLGMQFKYFIRKLGGTVTRRETLKRKRSNCVIKKSKWVLYDGFEDTLPLIKLLSRRQMFWTKIEEIDLIPFIDILELESSHGKDDSPWIVDILQEKSELVDLALAVLIGAAKFKKISFMERIQSIQEKVLSCLSQSCEELYCDNNIKKMFDCVETVLISSPMPKTISFHNHLSAILKLSASKDKKTLNVKRQYHLSKILFIIDETISSETSSEILMSTAAGFTALFESNEPCLQISTIAAMEKFALSLPSNHHHILPSCVPNCAQTLLQCRLGSKVYDFKLKKMNINTLPYHSYRELENRILSSSFKCKGSK